LPVEVLVSRPSRPGRVSRANYARVVCAPEHGPSPPPPHRGDDRQGRRSPPRQGGSLPSGFFRKIGEGRGQGPNGGRYRQDPTFPRSRRGRTSDRRPIVGGAAVGPGFASESSGSRASPDPPQDRGWVKARARQDVVAGTRDPPSRAQRPSPLGRVDRRDGADHAPPGAAIVTTVAEAFRARFPPMTIETIGLGAGTKGPGPGQANILRLFRRPGSTRRAASDRVWVLETNLDDLPGEGRRPHDDPP